MTIEDRIRTGALPLLLEGGDWRHYAGRERHTIDWSGWCRAWFGIAWVRLQAIEREAEAEAEAEAAYEDWKDYI